MLETYTIDSNLLGNIKKRMIKRMAAIMTIPMVVVFVPDFMSGKKVDYQTTAFSIVFIVAILVFTLNRALNKQINSFKTLKVVLNDEGIERKAELQPYKKIDWDNLSVKEKPNGSIFLYDRNISKFNRWMYGKGCISVEPETMDKDKLLNAIRLKAPYAFY